MISIILDKNATQIPAKRSLFIHRFFLYCFYAKVTRMLENVSSSVSVNNSDVFLGNWVAEFAKNQGIFVPFFVVVSLINSLFNF